jgi:transposase
MSLKPREMRAIPAETAALGKKILDENNPYRLIGDRLNDLIKDEDFSGLYTPIGGPALSPVILSLVLIFQSMEKLPDRAAAEAVKVRLDWKYALHLALDDEGFEWTNLSHFRQRLLRHGAEYLVFDRLLNKLVELGFVRRHGKQRTDATHVLGLIAHLSRLEMVWETLRVTLQALHQQAPDWHKQRIPETFWQEYWVKRSDYRLNQEEILHTLKQVGADGWWLLQQLKQAPQAIQALPEVQTMRTVWEQQFEVDQDGQYGGPRQKLDGSDLIHSPHDPQVHYSEKRGKGWEGYKAQVTETAEAKGKVNFIVDVAITDAQEADNRALSAIHKRLAERQLLPDEQYVDQAYISTQGLAESQALGIHLMGPAPKMPETGLFQVTDFHFDLELCKATCPGGCTSQSGCFSQRADGTQEYVFFFGSQCMSCALREQCTRAKKGRTVRYHIHHALLEMRQIEMQTDAFWEAMKRRSPIEGTISQLVRHGARRARYRGLRKVNLQWSLTALAVNLKRLLKAWALGYQPCCPPENVF